MKLSRQEVLRIARLARLGLSETEVQKFSNQLSSILENFQILQQVDTANVPPTAYPITLTNVVREDEAKPSLSQAQVLANAPRWEESSFQVKAVLE